MAVLPADRRKPKAGGIYYHADCKIHGEASVLVSNTQMSETLDLTNG